MVALRETILDQASASLADRRDRCARCIEKESLGAVVEAYDTDAYGNTLVFTAPDSTGNWWNDSAVQPSYGANKVIYYCYRSDPETELYYVRNCTYNPVMGRWLQRDPIGYSGGVNLYEYVGGMAASFTDAAGLQIASPGDYPPAPPINPAAGEAAEGLLAALAAELDWSWVPDVMLAAVATAAVVLAWKVTCDELHASYHAACDSPASHGRPGMFCDQYAAAIAARKACAMGRAAYINAGCDVINPTRRNHLGAMLKAWDAVENCKKTRDETCKKRSTCPGPV